jgi:uncharacterized protein YggE
MVGPVVVVRGEASVEGPPDLATLAVTVHRSGGSAEKVRSELAQASAALVGAVEPYRAGLASSGTSGLHVGPVLPYGESRRTSYRGSYGMSLVVRDFDVLAPLVTVLAEQAGAQIDGPWWSLDPQSPLPRQARLAAVEDARRRAEDYAAAFGATVVDVLEISDLDGGAPSAQAFAMARGGPATAVSFEPARQTATGQVTVRFAMSPAALAAPGHG